MYFIFSDASFRAADGTGVLAYLILEREDGHLHHSECDETVSLQEIKETSNIRCELRSVLAAMEYFSLNVSRPSQRPLHIYTDCQAIAGLSSRRLQLEQKNYLSGRTGLPLRNADLYKLIFMAFDQLSPVIHWIKGHSRSESEDPLRILFARVDHAARSQLRKIPS